MDQATHRLTLEIRLSDEHPSGVVSGAASGPRAFDGWLGLISTIDAALAADATHSTTMTRRLSMLTTARPPADVIPALRERVTEVFAPGDPGWDDARRAWILNAEQHPVAVAYPNGADEVAATVALARDWDIPIAVQGTGHGASGLGEIDDAILLRTTRMREVLLDPVARRARVGAGVEWEEVTEPAGRHGLVALHGSSPNVGVAGFVLGGGIGWLARSRGLACNSVTAIELVTMDGELVRADATHEPELFWALRGGGGFYGVVTAIELELFPLESAYAGWLVWPWERSEEILTAWAEWTVDAPEALTSVGRILQVPDIPIAPDPIRGKALVVVEVIYAGGEAQGAELVRPLRALGPMLDTVERIPASTLVRLHQDPEDPCPVVSGHAMLSDVGPEAVRTLVELVGPGSGSRLLSTEVRHLGGAAGRPAAGGGALSHLPEDYALFALGLPMDPADEPALAAEAERVEAEMSRFGGGMRYRNFSESRTDGRSFHSPEDLRRLTAVRNRFDPDARLRANHELEPRAGGPEVVG